MDVRCSLSALRLDKVSKRRPYLFRDLVEGGICSQKQYWHSRAILSKDIAGISRFQELG